MEQLKGFVDPRKKDFVFQLKRSLFGLKQSPHQWDKRFDSFITMLNFTRRQYDSCVYLKKKSSSPTYFLLYVDDILIAAKDAFEIQNIEDRLSKEFKMKDCSAAWKILGKMILNGRGAHSVSLSQKGVY